MTKMKREEAVKALKRNNGNQTAAAEELGLARSTLQDRLRKARVYDAKVAARNGKGKVTSALQATSSLYKYDDGNGNLVLEWEKKVFKPNVVDNVKRIHAVMRDLRSTSERVVEPVNTDKDLITVYPIADHHLGMYAWKLEAGEDYDVEIARDILRQAVGNLVSRTPASGTAVVLNLGDFFHSDNDDNRTRRSGNILDVDTRHARVLDVGIALTVEVIERAKSKHKKVIYRGLQGNHDPYSALALVRAIKERYFNDPRVVVDTDPSYFWYMRWGNVLLAATHGDMVKPQEFPGVMASHVPDLWGKTSYRYGYLGHVHHKSIGGGERAGAQWETFQTLAPKDAWHKSSGYVSGRSMVAITHHKDHGEYERNIFGLKGAG